MSTGRAPNTDREMWNCLGWYCQPTTLNFLAYSFSDLNCSRFFRIGQHDNKLFPAISRSEIARATHVSIDTLCETFQCNITLSVTVLVIVLFEAIRIDEQQRQGTIAALQSSPLVFEGMVESTTVLEPCKRVGLR